MRRRESIAALVAAALCERAAHASAQSGKEPPVVGFFRLGAANVDAPILGALREGLRERGYTEGQTIAIDARAAAGDLSLAITMVEDMARRPAAVFIAPGPAAARLIRRVTTIPIVAIGLPPGGEDGLFATLSRPGGSVTGFSSFGEELSGKRIEVLRELLPRLSAIGIMHNTSDPVFNGWGVQTEASAAAQGLRPLRLGLQSAEAGQASALLRSAKSAGVEAVIVIRDFLTVTKREEIVQTAATLRMPVIAEELDFVQAGALMSYGPDNLDLFRRAAGYVDQILKGAKGGDLPIELPTKFEFAINLKTAAALGLTIPPFLLARADEVIE